MNLETLQIIYASKKRPKIDTKAWIAPSADVIGNVEIGEDSSIWFGTVIRGDVNSIVIGDSVNIQDGVVVHCTYKKTKTIIGDNWDQSQYDYRYQSNSIINILIFLSNSSMVIFIWMTAKYSIPSIF